MASSTEIPQLPEIDHKQALKSKKASKIFQTTLATLTGNLSNEQAPSMPVMLSNPNSLSAKLFSAYLK